MTNIITWDERLVVDEGMIDDDHKLLIEIVNEFILIRKHFRTAQQARDIIERLGKYASFHFRREEELQQQIGFPTANDHAQVHYNLEEQLKDIQRMVGNSTGQELAMVSAEAARLIYYWLVEHILKHDLKMREYVTKMNIASKGKERMRDIVH